jgi:hypothetical protein
MAMPSVLSENYERFELQTTGFRKLLDEFDLKGEVKK